jgi:hypothetical protein
VRRWIDHAPADRRQSDDGFSRGVLPSDCERRRGRKSFRGSEASGGCHGRFPRPRSSRATSRVCTDVTFWSSANPPAPRRRCKTIRDSMGVMFRRHVAAGRSRYRCSLRRRASVFRKTDCGDVGRRHLGGPLWGGCGPRVSILVLEWSCNGAPALMKLFPLERYDILAFGLRMPLRASETRQNYYD